MLKAGALLVIGVTAIWGSITFQHGCRDATHSLTALLYPDRRDMRRTVGFVPNKDYMAGPDSLSVPTTGRERWDANDVVNERTRYEKTFVNPQAPDDSSIARGQRKFLRTCIPCHGMELKGDGPVAAKFIPPPDLLAATTRGRADGYIYSYIRHGGAVMPTYGAQVTAQEAYDLINYIRSMQKKNPR